jgi:hypothetical protein
MPQFFGGQKLPTRSEWQDEMAFMRLFGISTGYQQEAVFLSGRRMVLIIAPYQSAGQRVDAELMGLVQSIIL